MRGVCVCVCMWRERECCVKHFQISFVYVEGGGGWQCVVWLRVWGQCFLKNISMCGGGGGCGNLLSDLGKYMFMCNTTHTTHNLAHTTLTSTNNTESTHKQHTNNTQTTHKQTTHRMIQTTQATQYLTTYKKMRT